MDTWKVVNGVCNLLKLLVIILCTVLFLLLCFDIWHKYQTGMTGTAVSQGEGASTLFLPAMTFCPGPAYKAKGPFYFEGNFQANSYRLEDIFYKDTLDRLANETIYSVTEVRNKLLGRCFTIYVLQPVPQHEVNLGFFQLLRQWDVQLYLHEPGMEIFLSTDYVFPFEVTTTYVKTTHSVAADVHVSKGELNNIPSPRYPCKSYGSSDKFVMCVKSKLRMYLSTQLPCHISLHHLVNLSDVLPQCPDLQQAQKVFEQTIYLGQHFVQHLGQFGCFWPCKRAFYKMYITSYPENSGEVRDDSFWLHVYYDSLLVETWDFCWGSLVSQYF